MDLGDISFDINCTIYFRGNKTMCFKNFNNNLHTPDWFEVISIISKVLTHTWQLITVNLLTKQSHFVEQFQRKLVTKIFGQTNWWMKNNKWPDRQYNCNIGHTFREGALNKQDLSIIHPKEQMVFIWIGYKIKLTKIAKSSKSTIYHYVAT